MTSRKTDPKWSDITPLPQDDGPAPICAIAYTQDFVEVMDYFRAILQKNEKSDRALQLTEDVIDENPANYTAWFYRREILIELKKDLIKELENCEQIAEDNPKNYQIWYHRRVLTLELCKNKTKEEVKEIGKKELAFSTHILDDIDDDSKNYHCWAHRQWILTEFDIWDGELEYVVKKLTEDLRNNSVWNHRYFVISHSSSTIDFDTRKSEIEFAISYIKKAPNNASPWNYLRGFVKGAKFGDFNLKEFANEISSKFITCPHSIALSLDILEEEATDDSLQEAAKLCTKLADSLDQIRSKYWNYKKDLIEKQMNSKKEQ